MTYHKTGVVAVRLKGGGQVVQVTGLNDINIHKEIAIKVKAELEQGISPADAKEMMQALKAAVRPAP